MLPDHVKEALYYLQQENNQIINRLGEKYLENRRRTENYAETAVDLVIRVLKATDMIDEQIESTKTALEELLQLIIVKNDDLICEMDEEAQFINDSAIRTLLQHRQIKGVELEDVYV